MGWAHWIRLAGLIIRLAGLTIRLAGLIIRLAGLIGLARVPDTGSIRFGVRVLWSVLGWKFRLGWFEDK